jgi:branched-chain amino acid transport system substrate-binding protein
VQVCGWIAAIVACLGVGCSSAPRPAAPEALLEPTPDCEGAADRLARTVRELDDLREDDREVWTSRLATTISLRCKKDAWSESAVRCWEVDGTRTWATSCRDLMDDDDREALDAALAPLVVALIADSTSSPVVTLDERGPIRVGVVAPRGGVDASFGTSLIRGVELAVVQQNAGGGIAGRAIELVVGDSRSSPLEATRATEKVISIDRAVAVIGDVSSGVSMAAAAIAQEAGIPIIAPAATNPRLTLIGDRVFRTCFVDPFQGYALARFARDHLNAKRIAILVDDSQPYSRDLGASLQTELEALGVTVTTMQSYTPSVLDLSEQLRAIKASRPAAVMVAGYYKEGIHILRQARRAGLRMPFLAGDGWESAELIAAAGAAADNVYYSTHFAADDPRVEARSLAAEYHKLFGIQPDAIAALGYDAARVLFDAMSRSPTLTGTDIANALLGTVAHPGATGAITMGADREARKPAAIVRIRRGVPTFVRSIQPR